MIYYAVEYLNVSNCTFCICVARTFIFVRSDDTGAEYEGIKINAILGKFDLF